MVMPTKTSCKILQFATPEASVEGELEKWFRGVMKSNHDLVFALERLRDSYKQLMGEKASHRSQSGRPDWQSKLLSGTPGTRELCNFLTRGVHPGHSPSAMITTHRHYFNNPSLYYASLRDL